MIDLGLIQEDLRQPLQVKSRSAVGHYLAGRRQVTPAQLVGLAHALRCSLDWLLTGSGPVSAEGHRSAGETMAADENILLERYRQMAEKEKAALQIIVETMALATWVRRRKSAIAKPSPNDAG